MAHYDLPSEFDVVIYGTGLTESVIAAACARVGQKVLHVDSRDYYCGNWASFTFNGLLSWIEQHKVDHQGEKTAGLEKTWEECLEEGEELLPLSWKDSISNLEVYCYASQEAEEQEKQEEKCHAPLASEYNGAGEEERGQDRGTADGDMTEEEEQGEEVQGEKEESADGTATTVSGEEQGEEEKEVLKLPAQAEDTQSSDAQTEPRPDSTESQSEPREKKITYAAILKEGRRFNIDLVSKLLYSRGALVDLLIKSNVSRYTEFKNVTRILTYRGDKVEQVPCSRADVFSSKQLTVVEKRMLMKFLTFSLDYEQQPEEFQDFAERPYWDFLQTRKLTENLQHFLFHSIAMGIADTCTSEGLRATQHFLRCLGRYGNTPFLFSLYGLGEIPQAFCRMSAVFGGVYSLRHTVQCLVLDKESGKCKAVIDSHNKRITCSHFVVEESYVAAKQGKDLPSSGQISRAVLITDRSVLPSDSPQQVSLVTVPPVAPGSPPARMIELCSSTMTCMPGTYLVHLTSSAPSSSGSAHDDLSPVVSRMFHTFPAQPGEDRSGDERPTVLWAMYFHMRDGSGLSENDRDLPDNVYVCPGPDGALDSQNSIALAESVFQKILPEEEFCPPAPNPEDIIYDGDAPSEDAGFSQKEGEGEEKETKEQEETEEGEGEREEAKEQEETEEVLTQETATEPQEEHHLSTEE